MALSNRLKDLIHSAIGGPEESIELINAIISPPLTTLDVPIMAEVAILAIATPVQGQIILDSDTGTLVFYNGANWVELV